MFGTTPHREVVEANLEGRDADLVIQGGDHVNVHSGEIIQEDIAVVGDRVAYVGDVDHMLGSTTTVVDANEKFVTPGLIDGHHHSYHSYINGTEFAKAMLLHGTTAYADGFYAQAIVKGLDALEFRKEEMERTPLTTIFLAPCVAQLQCSVMGLPQTSPESIDMDDLFEMIEREDCYGLEEVTPDPIVQGDEDYFQLIERTIELNKAISGHAAGLDKRALNAFRASGSSLDHEMARKSEGVEWIRRGMHLLVRYGSGAPNVPEVVRALTEVDLDARNVGFSCDVLAVNDLVERGSIDQNVRSAIANGVDPITAVQAGSLGTAEALRVDHELGGIVPGKLADAVIVDDLVEFDIEMVISNGEVVVRDDAFLPELRIPDYPEEYLNTINLPGPAVSEDFRIEADNGHEVTVRVIEIEDGSYVTAEGRATLPVEDGAVQIPEDSYLVKGAMIDRHEASGRTGLAVVEGFDLDAGAFGMSANGVRENILLVGASDEDMAAVVNRIHDLQGGIVVVKDDTPIAEFSLRLSGIQSTLPLDEAVEEFNEVIAAIDDLGCPLESPLSTLEFIGTMPGIPIIRLNERGLINANTGERLDVVVER